MIGDTMEEILEKILRHQPDGWNPINHGINHLNSSIVIVFHKSPMQWDCHRIFGVEFLGPTKQFTLGFPKWGADSLRSGGKVVAGLGWACQWFNVIPGWESRSLIWW